MRRAFGVTVVLMLLLSVQAAYAGGPPFPTPPADDYDLFFDQVELRPGVTIDIHVKVFVNDQQPRPPFGKTVFAIPGGGHTAQSWDQYAEALFTHPFKGPATARLVALDPPGRGHSTGLTGIYFSELMVDDDVTAILATLDRLQGHGIYPSEIIGQCSGALQVQMAQERLVESGSSLFQEYGISRAVLLSPAIPAPIAWHWIDFAEPFLPFRVSDEELSWHFNVPAEAYLAYFFTNFHGQLSPDAPSPAEFDARGYRALWPVFWVWQIFGETSPMPGYPEQPPIPRPEVSPGIFGLQSGTLLHTVSYVDDVLVFPFQSTELFDYLVDCPWWSRNTVVQAEGGVNDRIHDLHISNPSVIIEAMSEEGWFLW
ncbi:MAG: hypothetical protein JSV79_13080 [Armatimonadota bacterium]|nr:MAG: hypothetical protein JSV79_13080 [Armatimonadota bacterium]